MRKPNPLLAFLIIGIAGTLWHFLYEWTGENRIVGAFAPINESTWEHLKLLFFPTVLYTISEYFTVTYRPENYIAAATIGLFSGLAAIVALFYSYTGILGYNLAFVDILIIFIGLFISIYIKSLIMRKDKFSSKAAKFISLYAVLHLAVLFFYWSFNPPSLGIFTPPVI